MATKLLYLEDFDVVSCEATVVSVDKNEDETYIVTLDQTCFYPRGGGQDWDTGLLKTAQSTFEVQEVRLDEQGAVQHIGWFKEGEFQSGETVKGEVETGRRQINTRLHSAGHVIDMSMSTLKPDWKPVRGGHYPHMSFVEYEAPEGAETGNLTEKLQEKVNMLSINDYVNQLKFVNRDELAKYCRHVPDNIPTNKPTRVVLYADDFGIPCGGTHVKAVKEVGSIQITKIKIKKGLAKVSYAVQGIN